MKPFDKRWLYSVRFFSAPLCLPDRSDRLGCAVAELIGTEFDSQVLALLALILLLALWPEAEPPICEEVRHPCQSSSTGGMACQ